MKWNYRIVKQDGLVSIREVYYSKDDLPISWSSQKLSPEARTVAELGREIAMIAEALTKGVLVVGKDLRE